MDKKMSAMLQIKNIMDDGADKDHSENSENSEVEEKQTRANASKDKDTAGKDDDGGRDRMVRGGSVTASANVDYLDDDTIFGEAVLGKKRSNSIEANRPRARQEHTNVFGSILENIHENINFEDDAHPEEEEE